MRVALQRDCSTVVVDEQDIVSRLNAFLAALTSSLCMMTEWTNPSDVGVSVR
jgi:hypothetical protein